MKRLLVFLLVLLLAASVSGCSVKRKNTPAATDAAKPSATVASTRVHNSFADTLPDFKFDGAVTESYDEGLRYAFSAPCSEKTFQKYVKALEKAGYKEKAVSGEGYYAAYLESGFYLEAALRSETVTVTVKRAN